MKSLTYFLNVGMRTSTCYATDHLIKYTRTLLSLDVKKNQPGILHYLLVCMCTHAQWFVLKQIWHKQIQDVIDMLHVRFNATSIHLNAFIKTDNLLFSVCSKKNSMSVVVTFSLNLVFNSCMAADFITYTLQKEIWN